MIRSPPTRPSAAAARARTSIVDLAYFNWTAAEGLNLIGGKFKNNLYRPGKYWLIWDNDLNPEGFGLTYVNGPFFANVLDDLDRERQRQHRRRSALAARRAWRGRSPIP